MSKKGYVFSAIIVLGAVALIAYYWHAGHVSPRKVLFVSASHTAFHEAVQDAFLKTAKSWLGGKVEVNAMTIPNLSDTSAVTITCDEVLSLPADCIVVVGRMLSQTLINLARKRKSLVPIVFVGVQNPVELELIESLEQPGGAVTGVITVSFEDSVPARLLYTTFPHTKSVLLPFYFPYDAAKEIVNKAEKTKDYLESKGVSVTLLPVGSLFESLALVEGLLLGHDIVMTVEGDALNDMQFAGLAKLAERYNTGYFSGAMSALKENVLIVYASELRYIAEAGFDQVVQILFHHKNPATLPVISLGSTRELVINKKRAVELGLSVNFDEINAKINADPALEAVRGRVRVVS